MPIKDLNLLKSRFQNGDKPDGADFIDLIDTLITVLDGTIENDDVPNGELEVVKLAPGNPLEVIHTSANGALVEWADSSQLSIVVTQNSHGFSVDEVLTINSLSQYVRAKADALLTAQPVGIVTEVLTTDSFVLTLAGRVTVSAALTPGTLHYVSPSAAGTWTDSVPAGAGQYIAPVLYGETASTGILMLGTRATSVVSGTGTFDPVYITPTVLATASVTTFTSVDIDALVPALSGIPFRFAIIQIDGQGLDNVNVAKVEMRKDSGSETYLMHRIWPDTAGENIPDANIATFFFPVTESPKTFEYRRTGGTHTALSIRIIGYIA